MFKNELALIVAMENTLLTVSFLNWGGQWTVSWLLRFYAFTGLFKILLFLAWQSPVVF